MIEAIREKIKKLVKEKVGINVVSSEKEDFGHYSTSVAFKLAPLLKKLPMEIASGLAEKLNAAGSGYFFKVEAAAPGFINFWLAPQTLHKELELILRKNSNAGRGALKAARFRAKKINLEFVSANPTGPLTMANGRGGFYGDALANVLEKLGNKVTREYYVNDSGNQIRILGESILAILGKAPKAESHYQGGYVKVLAEKLKSKARNNNAEAIGKEAAGMLLREIKLSLKKSGIKHDSWFSESKNLRDKGELKKVLALLEKKKLVEKKDGALWLGEAVLIKSDGLPTYLLADMAYHYDKFLVRKFDLAINIWGADHHGYASRLQKGVGMLGVDSRRLKIIITQLVRLVSKGKEVKMSKRKGEFITLDELIGKVGVDAARFFFLMYSPDTHMDFDLDLAKERSKKNPVYYAQYAYVRAANILRKAQSAKRLLRQIPSETSKSRDNLRLLNSESEIGLILELAKYPDILLQTAEDYQAHRLTKYALELAETFHNFYEQERVIGAGVDLEKVRLLLVSATKIVLENLFDILGISKPKKM